MLINELKSLPNSPGVYEYFDTNGKLLYIGKAKNLKNRVKSYFSFTPNLSPNPNLSPRIAKMINEAVHIEWIETGSENDALILENSFIKQLRPKYNILLRDDKTYPYIFIDLSADFPRFEITRKIIKGKGIKYFGPFYKGSKEILSAIYEQFNLVQKSSCLKGKKACIFYQMGRCKAPCENKISKTEYAKIVSNALKCLKNPHLLIPELKNKMAFYAISENYEEAANLRDLIKVIDEVCIKVQIDIARLEDFEAIAVGFENQMLCWVRLSVRSGKVAYSRHSITPLKSFNKSDLNEIYKQIILENFPPQIPLNATKIYVYDEFDDINLISDILSERFNKKITIQAPKIGDKRRICEIALQNANSLIKKHIKTHNYDLLSEIKQYFNLSNLPLKIECFDNSHIFGSAPVGAMICWEIDGFNKSNYRHIHLNHKNDYDQMHQMLTNRALRFDKLSPPDLWVIDGGAALLNLAKEILQSSGANVDIIAISKEKIDAKAHRAKGWAKDQIYTEFGKFNLNADDKKLQFFQKLRDEAHRFAISFHQKTKIKQDLQNSELEKIGISKGSIIKLINYFGSFENIKNAKFDEIAKISNKSVAQKIAKFNQI